MNSGICSYDKYWVIKKAAGKIRQRIDKFLQRVFIFLIDEKRFIRQSKQEFSHCFFLSRPDSFFINESKVWDKRREEK